MMDHLKNAVGSALLLATLLATLVPFHAAAAQTAPDAEDRFAIVARDRTYVRAGAADSYYPFGRTRLGDVVMVIGEKHDWVRVAMVGPAFDGFFGYVKHERSRGEVLRFEAEDRAIALGDLDVLAPNLNTEFRPRDSWKVIAEIPIDAEVTVLERIETDRALYYKVELPATAEGWISKTSLEEANETQIAAWRLAVSPVASGEVEVAVTEAVSVSESVDADGTVTESLTATESVTAAVTDGGGVTESESVTAAGTESETETVAVDLESVTEPVAADPVDEAIRETIEVLGRDEPLLEPVGDPVDAVITEEAVDEAIEAAGEQPGVRRLDLPQVTPPATPPDQVRLEELEAAYARLRREPIETAEVLILRGLYLQLADTAERGTRAQKYAEARAEQLAIWGELQERRREINTLRQRLLMTTEEAEAVRLALALRSTYVGVGRLIASTIFDGRRLPNLVRLQDAGTGRTLAYLRLDEHPELAEMLGQIVGIVGDKRFDAGLRLNIIDPIRIDLLAPQGEMRSPER